MNCQDLPEFFEDNMGKFMDFFQYYLVYNNQYLDNNVSVFPFSSLRYPIIKRDGIFFFSVEQSEWLCGFIYIDIHIHIYIYIFILFFLG